MGPEEDQGEPRGMGEEEGIEQEEEEGESPTRERLSCLQRIALLVARRRAAVQAAQQAGTVLTNERLLELLKPTRYKPQTVEQLAKETKFSKGEVKDLYRAFKGDCPTGIIDEAKFKEVYQSLFPLGESAKYAHLVFKSIDRDNTGGITFGDFMDFLSVLSKGSQRDKILWTFNFYDVNRDGCISRDEMMKVTDSILDLVGETAGSHGVPRVKMQNMEEVFSYMDTNKDGVVTEEEFMAYCTSNNNYTNNLLVLP